MTEKNTQKQTTPVKKPVSRRPNETGRITVEGFVKIFDPKNQEVYVEKRA